MANGNLGKAMSSSNAWVAPYSCPSGVKFATVAVGCCNTGTVEAKVRVAVSLSATPTAVDSIEYDVVLAPNGGVLERTCQLLSPNEKVVVYANSDLVAIRVSGLEQE